MKKALLLFAVLFTSFGGFAQFKYKMRPNAAIDIYKGATDFETIGTVQPFDTINLVSYTGNLWGIEYKGAKGYIVDAYVSEEVSGIPALKERYKKEYAAAEAAAKAKSDAAKAQRNKAIAAKSKADAAKAKAALKVKYTNLYGEFTANRILNGEIWVGMTEQMAKYSLGEPERVNYYTRRNGTSEQWVYNREYLYFKDGVLESFSQHY